MMGMPHDFELDNIKNINHIAQNVPVAVEWLESWPGQTLGNFVHTNT